MNEIIFVNGRMGNELTIQEVHVVKFSIGTRGLWSRHRNDNSSCHGIMKKSYLSSDELRNMILKKGFDLR